MFGGPIQFCQNFIDVCPNQNLLALHRYEKRFCPKLWMKNKNKVFTLNLSLISRFSSQKISNVEKKSFSPQILAVFLHLETLFCKSNLFSVQKNFFAPIIPYCHPKIFDFAQTFPVTALKILIFSKFRDLWKGQLNGTTMSLLFNLKRRFPTCVPLHIQIMFAI